MKGTTMKQKIKWGIFLLMISSAGFAATTYKDNGDGSVRDKETGLLWQKCSMGQTTNVTCSGTATTATWSAAMAYCENLTLGGRSDWRLPSVNELKSLVDYSAYNPAINTSYFPATVASSYWSSSTSVGNTTNAWYVGFYSGTDSDGKTSSYYVRCVSGP